MQPYGMKVVIDTNVFVDACLGQHSCRRVIQLTLDGVLRPLVGTALFLEYEAVLSREFVQRKSRLSSGEREELLDIFLAQCLWTPIYFGWRPHLPDEADNHLYELAIAGHAEKIITSNLTDLNRPQLRFDHLLICSPEQFLEELQA